MMASSVSIPTAPEAGVRPRFTHIPELDGIRGIAALLVLCHHLFFTSVPEPERWNWFVVTASRVGHAGGFGVDVFFVLSGFLITSLLIVDRESPHYYWNFYWKRVLRILPLYLLALIGLVAFLPQMWRYALLSLLFASNFAHLFHFPGDGPFWTLAIEEQFYLVWPQFARRSSTQGLERFAVGVAVGCVVLRLIDAAVGHSNFQFTFFHCDGLALGAMLACRRMRLGPGVEAREHGGRALLAMAAVSVALMAMPLVPVHGGAGSRWPQFVVALLLTGVTGISYCIVAFAVERSGSKTGAGFLAVLRSRTLTFFGLISYCLYMVNSYVVQVYDWARGPMQTGDMGAYAVRAVSVFAVTVGVCVVARYVVELPAARLRRHVLR
jgi:peptidoglycan/LPS O-acetylase OafA/YrhL